MARSVKKGPFIDTHLMKKVRELIEWTLRPPEFQVASSRRNFVPKYRTILRRRRRE